jgi:membrane fusion protein (multidrug efflux system)
MILARSTRDGFTVSIVGVVLGGLLLAGGTGCGRNDQPGGPVAVPEVATVAVRPQRVVLTRELPGRTRAHLVAEIRPQVSGLIQKRLFTEGTDVEAGDVLYQIDPSTYEAAYANAEAVLAAAKAARATAVAAQSQAKASRDNAKAALAAAKANHATAIAGREVAKASLVAAKAAQSRAEANAVPLRLREKRYAELVATRAVSQQDFDDVSAALKQSEAGIESAAAAVVGAESEIGRAEAALQVMEAEIQRAEVGIQSAEAEIESAAAAVEAARATIESAEAGLQTARINLGYTRITAPIAGRIGRSAVTTGALVTAHQPVALATVHQLDPVYVDVPQATADLLRLQQRLADGRLSHNGSEQATTRLILEDGSEYPHTGKLEFREVSVDPTTGSFVMRMVFPNPEGILLPGMFVRAVVEEGVREDAILVPQQAVSRNTKGEPFVLIVAGDNTVLQQMIVIDRAIGSQWLLASGLNPGDEVIVEGLQKVRPGVSVRAVSYEASQQSRSEAASTDAPAPANQAETE